MGNGFLVKKMVLKIPILVLILKNAGVCRRQCLSLFFTFCMTIPVLAMGGTRALDPGPHVSAFIVWIQIQEEKFSNKNRKNAGTLMVR